MTTPPPITITASRRMAASAEQVFDAWLDAATAGRWLFATPTGKMQRVEIDPRVGGRFTIVERRDDEDAAHFGRYVLLDRPRRLAFTFSLEQEEEGDPMTVDIEPSDAGTRVTLTHEMKPEWADYADRTRDGWQGILDGLAATLESHDRTTESSTPS